MLDLLSEASLFGSSETAHSESNNFD